MPDSLMGTFFEIFMYMVAAARGLPFRMNAVLPAYKAVLRHN